MIMIREIAGQLPGTNDICGTEEACQGENNEMFDLWLLHALTLLLPVADNHSTHAII